MSLKLSSAVAVGLAGLLVSAVTSGPAAALSPDTPAASAGIVAAGAGERAKGGPPQEHPGKGGPPQEHPGKGGPHHDDPDDQFDLQAHRGGQALVTESTPEAFANALELGVTTLELDTQVTADGHVIITHDRQINPADCRDTAPATPDDPQYPYAGDYITDLTLKQVLTLECGYQQDPSFPEQQVATGPMMQLEELFTLVRDYGADDVVLNIETKVEAAAPEETAPREEFVAAVLAEIDEHDMGDQVTIQSFDWGALQLVGELAPHLPRVALTNYSFLEIGRPGASPWLGGLDADDYQGDLVALAKELKVDAISPVHGSPQDGAIGDGDYLPYTDRAMVVDAHEAGMKVIPWTVNDRATMEYLLDIGVDGIITDQPDLLREIMAERGMELPQQYQRVSGAEAGPPIH